MGHVKAEHTHIRALGRLSKLVYLPENSEPEVTLLTNVPDTFYFQLSTRSPSYMYGTFQVSFKHVSGSLLDQCPTQPALDLSSKVTSNAISIVQAPTNIYCIVTKPRPCGLLRNIDIVHDIDPDTYRGGQRVSVSLDVHLSYALHDIKSNDDERTCIMA